MDGKTEQYWRYSDYAASKNDGTLDAHTKIYFDTNWLTSTL